MLKSPVLEISAIEQARAPVSAAVRDLVRGIERAELWGTMGWLDIRQRYSRSVMGPFWVTLSLGAFVAGIGATYGALFRMPMADYLPYLTIGMVVWTLLSSFLVEGCRVFIDAQAAIKQMPAPISVHVYRLSWRSLIVFGHNAIIIVVVLLATQPMHLLTGIVPALLGLTLTVVTGACFALTLGTLSARFRDIPPLMTNVVQMMFFVTPILWRASDLGDRSGIALWNPIYHLIEIVRAPLLGSLPTATNWAAALGFTAANLVIAILFYARFRWRIPYWL